MQLTFDILFRQEIVKSNDQLTEICNLLGRVIAPIIQRLIAKQALKAWAAAQRPFLLKLKHVEFIRNAPEHLSTTERTHIRCDFYNAFFLKGQLRDIERSSVFVPLKKFEDCKGGSGTLAAIRENPDFIQIVDKLREYSVERDGRHPKFVALENIIIKHFEDYANYTKSKLQSEGSGEVARISKGGGRDEKCFEGMGTRVMVFASGRDSVDEIVSRLSSSGSLVKPAAFIGQAAGKKDKKTGAKSKGQTQKEQSAVLQSFRMGIVNTLICTCIGEEGLDVGEVDLIVHYDLVQSTIRNIQRSGRTGRKRSGCVLRLLMEGQEEADYRQMCKKLVVAEKTLKQLAKGKKLILFPDNNNFLPRAPKMVDAQVCVST
jgi:ERCC4-related helicase